MPESSLEHHHIITYLPEMPLLPNIKSEYVHLGLWWNCTAPAYQRCLWTTTNVNAVLFIGVLSILGGVAGDKLWKIMRYHLQPALQLSDSDDRRLKLSRTAAITAIWAELKYVKEDLEGIWHEEQGINRKLRDTFEALSGNYAKTLRPPTTTIEIRFGIFAILSITCFVVLSIFIPFFLTDGLQGEAIVQATQYSRDDQADALIWTLGAESMHQVVSWDFEKCVNDRATWSQANYCVDLHNDIPPYESEEIDLTDLVLAQSPYSFLVQLGDANHKATRMSRNTSTRDLAFNARMGGKTLLHEVTCVPVSLDQHISKTNRSFELKFPNLIPPGLAQRLKRLRPIVVHDSMTCKLPMRLIQTMRHTCPGEEMNIPTL